MSYSLRKVRTFIDDSTGDLRTNASIVKRYAMAYDDRELGELMDLLVPTTHYASFWGTARGPDAAVGIAEHEHGALRLTWVEPFQPVTANVFERSGYAQFLDDRYVPVIGSMLQRMRQQKVRESIVIRDGCVVFRELGLCWRMMVI